VYGGASMTPAPQSQPEKTKLSPSAKERREWRAYIKWCNGCNTAAAQQYLEEQKQEAREKVVDELQLWRMKRMNGTLKKDVWQAWNEETDFINKIRQQTKEQMRTKEREQG